MAAAAAALAVAGLHWASERCAGEDAAQRAKPATGLGCAAAEAKQSIKRSGRAEDAKDEGTQLTLGTGLRGWARFGQEHMVTGCGGCG